MKTQEMIQNVISRIGNTEDKLIEVLMEIQKESTGQYISESKLRMVGHLMKIPISKIYGVATFYALISTEKRGEYVIQICDSAPCFTQGSEDAVALFESILGIEMGGITEDHQISLEYTPCIGACDIAPAAKINGVTYGNLDRDKVIHLVSQMKRGEI